MKKILEQTDKFIVVDHGADPTPLYELIDKMTSHHTGIYFSSDDAFKFKDMLDAPLKPTETLNKRLRKIYNLAHRNIDRGRPKL